MQIQGAAWIAQAPTLSFRFTYPANLLDICLHLDVKGHNNVAQAELEGTSFPPTTISSPSQQIATFIHHVNHVRTLGLYLFVQTGWRMHWNSLYSLWDLSVNLKLSPNSKADQLKTPGGTLSLILDLSFSRSTEAIHQQVKVVHLPGTSQTWSFSQLPPTPPGPGRSPGLSLRWIIAMRLPQVPSYPLLYQCSSLGNFF